LKGVERVISGYAAGKINNPTYEEICSGSTGHAEVIAITYDDEQISFSDLLNVFWHVHDPTTLNQQGGDRGTQYRSIILHENEEEKKWAEESLKATDESSLWSDPIVTEITPLDIFYSAEDYHQNYYNNNQRKNPYCSIVIAPKMAKFQKEFAHLIG
jgi:peptide-methionine (S)-S-oxide reductase